MEIIGKKRSKVVRKEGCDFSPKSPVAVKYYFWNPVTRQVVCVSPKFEMLSLSFRSSEISPILVTLVISVTNTIAC